MATRLSWVRFIILKRGLQVSGDVYSLLRENVSTARFLKRLRWIELTLARAARLYIEAEFILQILPDPFSYPSKRAWETTAANARNVLQWFEAVASNVMTRRLFCEPCCKSLAFERRLTSSNLPSCRFPTLSRLSFCTKYIAAFGQGEKEAERGKQGPS